MEVRECMVLHGVIRLLIMIPLLLRYMGRYRTHGAFNKPKLSL